MVFSLLIYASSLHTLQYIGAMYVYSAGGDPLATPRRAFFDTSDPSKPVIRVPQSAQDELVVLSYYSWDSSKFGIQKHMS